MKYYSEKTKGFYDTEDELHLAEDKYAKKEKEKEELANQRKIRANEVSDAYNEYQAVIKKATEEIRVAEDKYLDLRDKFAKDYGSYHMTYYNDGKTSRTFFDTVNDIFTNFFLN